MRDTDSSTRRRILSFIGAFSAREGMSPTIREINDAIGLHSTGSVYFHLKKLESSGLITWIPGKSRAIFLTTAPRGGIPIIGTIAAGEPLDHFPDNERETLNPQVTVFPPQAYALRVKGDSMIDDHIANGDLVIVAPDQSYHNGDIVVATHLIATTDVEAATLKRIYREPRRIRLQPANATMPPIYVDAREWDREWVVQGKVVALYRHWS